MGLMIQEPKNRLVVAADWSPFNIVVTTDEAMISDFLSESEVMEIPRYIQKYGFS
jgi:RIO-like serine/threonine protein kinase